MPSLSSSFSGSLPQSLNSSSPSSSFSPSSSLTPNSPSALSLGSGSSNLSVNKEKESAGSENENAEDYDDNDSSSSSSLSSPSSRKKFDWKKEGARTRNKRAEEKTKSKSKLASGKKSRNSQSSSSSLGLEKEQENESAGSENKDTENYDDTGRNKGGRHVSPLAPEYADMVTKGAKYSLKVEDGKTSYRYEDRCKDTRFADGFRNYTNFEASDPALNRIQIRFRNMRKFEPNVPPMSPENLLNTFAKWKNCSEGELKQIIADTTDEEVAEMNAARAKLPARYRKMDRREASASFPKQGFFPPSYGFASLPSKLSSSSLSLDSSSSSPSSSSSSSSSLSPSFSSSLPSLSSSFSGSQSQSLNSIVA
ncbi:hypothetical protein FACS189465_0830 [Clostridia bacterium]|nr:hypothetical protein FACS189465_0830 [Clostridia bacterium]